MVIDDLLNPSDDSLPACLRRPQVLELNASAKYSTFVLKPYASFNQEGDHKCLKTGVLTPFRLYHSQSESFLLASCNQDKNDDKSRGGRATARVFVPPSKLKALRRHTSKGASFVQMGDDGTTVTFGDATPVEESPDDGDSDNDEIVTALRRLPPHVPYLRLLTSRHSRSSEEPDPTDPRNHVAKGLWAFERYRRSSASAVTWGEAVRIRHLPSGRYLAVDTSSPFYTAPVSGAEVGWYRCYLVEDATTDIDLLEDGAFGGFADEEAMLFHVETDGGHGRAQTSGAGSGGGGDDVEDMRLPLGDSNVVIEHRRATRCPSDGSVKTLRLFLSNPEVPKPKRPWEGSAAAAGAVAAAAAAAVAAQTEGGSGGAPSDEDESLMIVFSTQRSAQV